MSEHYLFLCKDPCKWVIREEFFTNFLIRVKKHVKEHEKAETSK